MTTNLKSKEITETYGSRMLSRMASGAIISIDGHDDRIAKKNKREIPVPAPASNNDKHGWVRKFGFGLK
jgi:DNA-binding LacI/PurR family transcriptional regulator